MRFRGRVARPLALLPRPASILPSFASAEPALLTTPLQVYLRYARKYGCDLSPLEVLQRFR